MTKKGRRSKKAVYSGLVSWQKTNIPWNKGLKSSSVALNGGDDEDQVVPWKKRVQEFDVPKAGANHEFNTAFRLRPAKDKIIDDTTDCDENIIVGMKNLQDLIEKVQEHDSNCRSHLVLKIQERKGLFVSCGFTCTHADCNFGPHDPVPMSEGVHVAKTGPKASVLNEQLVLAVTKTKMGPADACFLLASMNIKPPSKSALYSKLNRTGEVIIKAAEEAMATNQSICRAEQLQAGKPAEITVEADAAFNNRPQSGYEAASQSFSAVMENDRGLVLSCGVKNKICLKKNCMHDSCEKNYGAEETMSSSEKTLIIENLKRISDASKVEVAAITTDASAQLEKVINGSDHVRPMKHYLCVVHRMRSFQKALRSLRLTTSVPAGANKETYKRKLISAFRRRIYWEIMSGARRRKSTGRVQQAVTNVMSCFSGQHENCRKTSFICHGPTDKPPRYLPYNKYVNLSDEDEISIDAVINRFFNETELDRVRARSTNKSENLHSMVFTYAPKHTLYARNFRALCHSAVHTKTFGAGKSTLIIASKMNIMNTATASVTKRYMQRKDKRALADAKRQATKSYKRQRYLSRKKKMNRELRKESINKFEEAAQEHNYGISV